MSAPATADDHPLSAAFMRGHPADAARVLDALPAADTAALLARAPARLVAPVLAAMLPHRAALALADLDDARTLELLAAMPTQPIVALLRQLPVARRRRLAGGLPTVAALASALLLGYADDTLGAWADPDVAMLETGTRAGDALDRVRAAPLAHPWVFVAGAERRLVGEVPLARLLAAPPTSTLARLMQPPPVRLAAHASLSGAADHPGWTQRSLLPVVEPGDRLVGVLTRDALARALLGQAPAASSGSPATAALLARSTWQLLGGVLDIGVALLPRVPPVWPAAAESAPARSPDDPR